MFLQRQQQQQESIARAYAYHSNVQQRAYACIMYAIHACNWGQLLPGSSSNSLLKSSCSLVGYDLSHMVHVTQLPPCDPMLLAIGTAQVL
jgi:hypothetical protein